MRVIRRLIMGCSDAESWCSVLFIALVAFLVYGQTIGHGFSVIDDQYLVVSNLAIRGPTPHNLWTIFTSYDPELYIPLTLLSYQLNYLLGGLDASVYHATNVLLHALCAILVMKVAHAFTAQRRVSVIAGLFFLLHPLNAEAVSWVAGRKDLLSAAFALGAILAYVRFRQCSSKKYLVVTAALLACSMLSKSSSMLLPLVFVTTDVLLERRKLSWEVVKEKWLLFSVSLMGAAIALGGKTRVVTGLSLYETVLVATKSIVFYVTKLVWPSGLSPFYPWVGGVRIFDPSFAFPCVTVLVAAIGLFLLKRRAPALVAASVSSLLLLAPSFANAQKGTTLFFAVDRYVYLAMVPLIIVGFAYAAQIFEGLRRHARTSWILVIVCILGALGFTSSTYASYWQDDETLLHRSINLQPDNVPARSSLSIVLRERGDLEGEKRILVEGLKIRRDLALLLGIGSVDARLGHVEAAKTAYEEALSMDPTNPEPYFYLGSLSESQGNLDTALEYYKQAIDRDQSYVAAINNAGAILMDQGKLDEAEELMRRAVSWNKSFMEGEYNLFQILSMKRERDEGILHLRKAYALAPEQEDVALSMAYAFYEDKDMTASASILRGILKRNPSQRTAARLLALIEGT